MVYVQPARVREQEEAYIKQNHPEFGKNPLNQSKVTYFVGVGDDRERIYDLGGSV